MAAPTADVLIVGGGLAGSLLALELRALGAAVTLIDAEPADGSSSATAISYGALPGWPLAATPLARLAAGASQRWRQLERRHGPLGWQRRALRLSGGNRALALAARLAVLPFAQVDTGLFRVRMPAALRAAAVTLRCQRVEALRAIAGGWQLQLSDGSVCSAAQVVLAAGARVHALWPGLPQRLRQSWASVLALSRMPEGLGPGAAWLPQTFARVALERRASALQQPAWVVDPGLVPWGSGALVGQHTWIPPEAMAGAAPDAPLCAAQLREALAARTPWRLPDGVLRQAAVAFCSSGAPLVGPVAGAPGLWLFCGFSAAFSQVPVLAPLLARSLRSDEAVASRRLQQLGVWSAGG